MSSLLFILIRNHSSPVSPSLSRCWWTPVCRSHWPPGPPGPLLASWNLLDLSSPPWLSCPPAPGSDCPPAIKEYWWGKYLKRNLFEYHFKIHQKLQTSGQSNWPNCRYLGLELVPEAQQLGVAEVDWVLRPHPGVPATVVTLPELDVPTHYDVNSYHPMTQWPLTWWRPRGTGPWCCPGPRSTSGWGTPPSCCWWSSTGTGTACSVCCLASPSRCWREMCRIDTSRGDPELLSGSIRWTQMHLGTAGTLATHSLWTGGTLDSAPSHCVCHPRDQSCYWTCGQSWATPSRSAPATQTMIRLSWGMSTLTMKPVRVR